MFYKFNINTFNFIVKVGGQRGLVEFFDTAIPDPWSSFSFALYSELTGFFQLCTKNEPGCRQRGAGALKTMAVSWNGTF
jgi:hypothetical protein